MFSCLRFFYDDAAKEGTGGGDNEGQQQSDDKGQQQASPELSPEIQAQLKELEELRAYKAANPTKPAEKTKEEIEKEEQLEKVNFRKFAVEKDLAKDDDFVQLETLQQKKDADLVFEDFAKQWKEENPDADAGTLEEDLKEAFNTQYHLNSENKTLKNRGLKLLEKDAKDIRSPYETKITSAKQQYQSDKEKQNAQKADEDFVKNKYIPFAEDVKKSIPTKLVYSKVKSGEEDVSVEIEVSQKEIDEAEKKFLQNHKAAFQFKEGKPEEVKTKLLEKITNYLILQKREEGNAKLAETFEGIGLAKGKVGADNPFALKNGKVVEMQAKSLSESNNEIGAVRQSANAYR